MHLAVGLSIFAWAWRPAELSVLPDVMACLPQAGNYSPLLVLGERREAVFANKRRTRFRTIRNI